MGKGRLCQVGELTINNETGGLLVVKESKTSTVFPLRMACADATGRDSRSPYIPVDEDGWLGRYKLRLSLHRYLRNLGFGSRKREFRTFDFGTCKTYDINT